METTAYESTHRILPDWIDGFCEFAKDPTLPQIFTTWTAISAIAAMLERRVYTFIRREPLFPNLYVLFVSPPGGGKSSTIGRSIELIREVTKPYGDEKQKLKFAPDDVTKASLIDALHQSTRFGSDDLGSEYSALYLAADEFGTAMSFLASDLLSFISAMYDGRPTYQEQRRGRGAKPLVIPYPIMNIISGVQPGFLAQNVPELAWSQGFLARFLLIYATGQKKTTVFSDTAMSMQLRDKLIRDLTTIFTLRGELIWGEGAKEGVDEFAFGTAPNHPRLAHYNTRRHMFLAKVALVSAVSRGNSMVIGIEDVERAAKWLYEAEATMPLVFKNMAGASDEMLLQEALFEMRALYKRSGVPLDPTVVYGLFASRAKAHQVQPLMVLARNRGDFTVVNGLIVPN